MGPLTIEQPGILEYTFVKADFGGAVPVVGVVVFIDEANNKIIKADATTKLKPCHGLVSKILPGLKAEVQSGGILDFGADKEYTLGSPVYLSTTAGDLATDVSAYTDSNLVQEVGTCVDDTGTTKVLLHPQGANALFLEKIQRMLKGSVVTELSTMLSKGTSGSKSAATSADDLVLENDSHTGITLQMPLAYNGYLACVSSATAAQVSKTSDMALVLDPQPNGVSHPSHFEFLVRPHADSVANERRVIITGPDEFVGGTAIADKSWAMKAYDRVAISGSSNPFGDVAGTLELQRDDASIVDTDVLGQLNFTGDDPDALAYSGHVGATIQGVATEGWALNQHGTAVEIWSTLTGTAAPIRAARFGQAKLEMHDHNGAVRFTAENLSDRGWVDLGVSGAAYGALRLHTERDDGIPAYVSFEETTSGGGSVNYIFCEDDGTLKRHTAPPSVHTQGSEVGLQSFTGVHFYDTDLADLALGEAVRLAGDKVVRCTIAKDPAVIGVYAGATDQYKNSLTNAREDGKEVAAVASVGDTRTWSFSKETPLMGFRVCNENGAIAPGDLLCTSSKPGRLMKQDDDLMHAYTVGKAMEAVSFDDNGDADGVYGFLYCG